MKRLYLLLLVFILLVLTVTPLSAKTYKLYYLGGQSNMDGYGTVSELPADLNKPVPNVLIYQSSRESDNMPVNGIGKWSPLMPGHGSGFKSDGLTNTYSNRFGLELTFGKHMNELDPTMPIALVKYSKGGTSIHPDQARKAGCWDPDFYSGNGINQYDHFLATLRNALSVDDIDGDGEKDTLIPCGILWMQGESDGHAQNSAEAYEANLKKLMDQVRAALRVDDLPVVVGRISDSGQDDDGKVWDYGDIVRKAEADYCDKDPYAALVTSTDNYGYSDRYHYDTAGFIDLGVQFANTMHKLEQKESTAYLFTYFNGNGEDGLHLAYSYNGLDWKALNNGKSFLTPMVGGDKLMRDPCVIQGPDGLYHMVWTVSWKEKGIGYASSKDLVHWSEQKYIPVMEHEAIAQNTWAPEVYYDDATEQYYIFWSTTIPGRFPETDHKDPRDTSKNMKNHRMYYVTTKDFDTFSDTKLFYDHGFNVIDGTLTKNGDQYVMYLKNETDRPLTPEKNIRIATSNKAAGPYTDASKPITGDYWAEGPTAIKIGDWWYVYFDKYRKHKYGAVRSKDLKNWDDISKWITHPDDMRHGTVFEVPQSLLDSLLKL